MEVREMNLDQLNEFIAARDPHASTYDDVGEARMRALELESTPFEKSEPSNGDNGDRSDNGDHSDNGDRSKYNTIGKRGPNLGTGAYAKQRIQEGADNKTILEEIREKFPEAKTTNASINFYRNALKKADASRTPEALRAEAAALRVKATELDAEASALETASNE